MIGERGEIRADFDGCVDMKKKRRKKKRRFITVINLYNEITRPDGEPT